MFETSGTTDVIEKSAWYKNVVWFAAGCFVTLVVFYMLVTPSAKRAAAESAEKAAQQKFAAELAKNPVEAQLESTKAALQTASQDRDECKAKFDHETILYDNSILIDPGKIWIIPVEVDPIAVGDHRVSYTHYDPRTKTESVHLKPLRQ